MSDERGNQYFKSKLRALKTKMRVDDENDPNNVTKNEKNQS